jgi:hypothetical protein
VITIDRPFRFTAFAGHKHVLDSAVSYRRFGSGSMTITRIGCACGQNWRFVEFDQDPLTKPGVTMSELAGAWRPNNEILGE